MLRVNIHYRKEGFGSKQEAQDYIDSLGLDPALTQVEIDALDDDTNGNDTGYVEVGEDHTRRLWINEVPAE